MSEEVYLQFILAQLIFPKTVHYAYNIYQRTKDDLLLSPTYPLTCTDALDCGIRKLFQK